MPTPGVLGPTGLRAPGPSLAALARRGRGALNLVDWLSASGRYFRSLAARFHPVKAALGAGVVISAVVAFVVLEPGGERVGSVGLHPPTSFELEARAGDALTFLAEVTPNLAPFEGGTKKTRASYAAEELQRSHVTIEARSGAGATSSTKCALSDGVMTSFSNSNPVVLETTNSCSLRLGAGGHWTLVASVNWAPKLEVTRAALVVSREHAE